MPMLVNRFKQIIISVDESGELKDISYTFHDSHPEDGLTTESDFIKGSYTRESLESIKEIIRGVLRFYAAVSEKNK